MTPIVPGTIIDDKFTVLGLQSQGWRDAMVHLCCIGCGKEKWSPERLLHRGFIPYCGCAPPEGDGK